MKAVVAGLAVLFVLGAFFFRYAVPGPPPSAEMTPEEIAQIEAEVGAVGDLWLAAAGGIDANAFLSLFDPANTYAVDGAYYANYEDWTGRIERLFSTWQEVNWAWAITRVDVLGPDAAMFVGETEGTRTRTDGVTSQANAGITLLVRRLEDVWKITFQGSAGIWTPSGGG